MYQSLNTVMFKRTKESKPEEGIMIETSNENGTFPKQFIIDNNNVQLIKVWNYERIYKLAIDLATLMH